MAKDGPTDGGIIKIKKQWIVKRIVAKDETPDQLAMVLSDTLNEIHDYGYVITQIINHNSGGYTIVARLFEPGL